MSSTDPDAPAPIRDALARLGIDRLVLSIHQASFPAGPDDLGHGTPHAEPAARVIALAARLGFTGLSLGPGGITSRDNPSPYDATALSRNPLHIAPAALAGDEYGHILDRRRLDVALFERPAVDRVSYVYAWDTIRRLVAAAADELRTSPGRHADLAARLAAFRAASAAWMAGEEAYEAMVATVGHDDWRLWPDAPLTSPAGHEAAERFALAQLVVHEQHAAFHRRVRAAGLSLYGDLPIGLGHRDRLLRRDLFLGGYALGAPPSRTNPAGQAWGFPVLDPDKLGPGGAGRDFLVLRFDKLFSEHDGVRVDHPHGWVCPWVYRTDDGDPETAVQRGARLHETPAIPELADHPALHRHARVRPDQIDLSRPRHDDAWVRGLDPAQVDRYAQTMDLVLERATARGLDTAGLLVEVLSTCPRPLAAVLARHGLGRFRVTQKARVDQPHDVYRGDTSRPEDWIMVGNHDTPPLTRVVESWEGTAEASRRAAYLAARLAPEPARAALAERLERNPTAMRAAMLAELFLGPARNVSLFWVDLFGGRDVYNRPGVVSHDNWCLRLPTDVGAAYAEARARGDAPDLPALIAWAMRARGLDASDEGRGLVAALDPAPRT